MYLSETFPTIPVTGVCTFSLWAGSYSSNELGTIGFGSVNNFKFPFPETLTSKSRDSPAFNFVFEENDLVLYLATQEVDRESYANLSLLNHDFSSTDPNQLREINLAVKSLIERQPTIIAVDMLANYTFSLMDYLFVVFVWFD